MTTMIPPQRKTLTAIADEIRWAAMQADCAADIEPDGAGFYAGEARGLWTALAIVEGANGSPIELAGCR